jgi:thiol-disulfide isomerase/thioredoxin
MMKTITGLFISVTALVLTSCSSEPELTGNFHIKGKLTNAGRDSVFLVDANSQNLKKLVGAPIDENGEFDLALNLDEAGFYRLELDEQNFAILIGKPGDTLNIEGDAKNFGYTYSIKGSPESQQFLEMNRFSQENARKKNMLAQKKDSLMQMYQYLINQNKDKKYIDSLDKAIGPQYDALDEQLSPIIAEGVEKAKTFIQENPKSFAQLVAIGLLSPESDFGEFEKVYNNLKAAYPDSKNLAGYYSWIEEKKRLQPGGVPPDFIVLDTLGNPVALSSFKGKILLVDFWASWCAPCRKENPNVVKLYKKYKDKGLEIFGVSLDDDKVKWVKAIQADGLTWRHGSELKGWNSTFVPLYGIQGIPFTLLLDREGKVIATKLRGPALEQKLEELFSSVK